jgi:hypothetical protein
MYFKNSKAFSGMCTVTKAQFNINMQNKLQSQNNFYQYVNSISVSDTKHCFTSFSNFLFLFFLILYVCPVH